MATWLQLKRTFIRQVILATKNFYMNAIVIRQVILATKNFYMNAVSVNIWTKFMNH